MAFKGQPAWNKGRKWPKSSIEKMRKAKLGKKATLEQRKKRSELWKKYYKEGRIQLKHGKGEQNSNWRGGKSDPNHILRTSLAFKNWREQVFERDNYTCQKCGDDKGGNLHPHHIKFWHEYPELRFDISNGLTVCEKCHRDIHKGKNYGRDN